MGCNYLSYQWVVMEYLVLPVIQLSLLFFDGLKWYKIVSIAPIFTPHVFPFMHKSQKSILATNWKDVSPIVFWHILLFQPLSPSPPTPPKRKKYSGELILALCGECHPVPPMHSILLASLCTMLNLSLCSSYLNNLDHTYLINNIVQKERKNCLPPGHCQK